MVALALLVAVVVGLWLTNRQDEPELRNPRTGAPVIPAPDSQAGYLGSCDPALPVEELDSGARAALSAACWQEQNLADNSTAEAIASFEVVLAHHPEFLPVLARLAQLYALQGGYSRAVPMAKRALQRDPNHPVALFVLADAAFRWSFDWPQAERLFQRGLAAAPEDLRLRIGYANLLSATRRHERAVALARETVAMAPHYLDGRFELAEELYLAGRFREAIAECQALVEIEPKAISAELLIAYSSLALDDPATALAAANRGLEAWGWPPAAATSLEGLWQLIFEGQTFKTPFDPGQLSERAFLAFGAGRTDEAGQLMARACRERSGWSLPYYDVDPRFAPLHALPGLESLERCLTGEYDLGALPAETVRSPSNP
jgi:tetratricopeptide (TPR) repeat protein